MTEYVNPDGTPWVPAFPGQRPPFQPGNTLGATAGNTLAQHHGARSARAVEPIAKRLIAELHEDPDLDYLRAQPFKGRAWDWARAEARYRLVADWLDAAPVDDAEGAAEARTAPLERLRQLSVHASNLAARCGLTPLVDDNVAAEIAEARKRRARTAEREQFAADLRNAARLHTYGDEQ